jgi:hypothetical protein
MSTLLRANLQKTNNPFILLKCYLEDILKKDKLTWKELIESMINTNEPKMSPQLIQALQALLKSDKTLNVRLKQGTKPKGKGERGTYEQLSDDPYVYSVKETNVRNLLDAIKNSDWFQKDPTTVKPIIDGLTTLIEDISAHQSEQRPRKFERGEADLPMRRKPPTSKDRPNKQAIADLNKARRILKVIKKKLEVAELDFDGDLIYDESVEKVIFNIIKDKHDIVQLKRLAGREYVEESTDTTDERIQNLRKEIFNLLNKETTFATPDGNRTERLVDAIVYAYQQKTGVVLADIADHKNLYNKKHAIWDVVNEEGWRGLQRLLSDPKLIERAKKRKPKKETKVKEEEAFEEIMEESETLLDRLFREGKAEWGI